jgi:predicted ester cyclase
MTRDDIVALFARRQDAIARRDVNFIVSQHAPDCVHVSPLAGTIVKGREAIGQLYDQWFKGFPDYELTSEELLIDGDRVVQVSTQSGTDTGGFMGLPPTGKPFRVPVVWLFTLKDNQFVYVRPIYDFTGTLVQIGVLKAKPAV